MSGEPEPSFTLSVPLAWPADSLASRGLRLGDLDGDGLADLLAITPLADASSLLMDTGAVYLWSPRLLGSGSNVPLASFRDPKQPISPSSSPGMAQGHADGSAARDLGSFPTVLCAGKTLV